MTQFFQFEADFVESLRCIPMQVRFKLDTCGIKLKLQHWHQFTTAQRQTLVDLPCERETEIFNYRSLLRTWVLEYSGTYPSELEIASNPDWLNATTIPESVHLKSLEVGHTIRLEQWLALSPLQRFALIKLSSSNHENSNFFPALEEFHLSQT
ncbi:nitrate reductase associated protein [Tumidithrix elongata RA019]|uniref:Nitrate reductase associated protein n=1 Tax=Tumidithrix elongata BACA0141 TaxID=2716417 RepID=A0AAW9PX72_9CYAN|nr:nitrate reductase associated protein [Tumidithrix elongata RA019]